MQYTKKNITATKSNINQAFFHLKNEEINKAKKTTTKYNIISQSIFENIKRN